MATSTSSYLIDTGKKCYIPSCGEVTINGNNTKINSTLMGDIDTKTLNNLGFEVTEDFAEAQDEIEKIVEKFSKPFTTSLNAILKQSAIFRKVNFEFSADTVRDTAIFVRAIRGIMNGDTNDTEFTKLLDDTVSWAYKYRIPLRKTAPSIGLSGGNNITISFAYGKCNLFSAKKEVWEPLMKIKANLFPHVGNTENNGRILVKGVNVPYSQEATIITVKSLVDTISGGFLNSLKSLTDIADLAASNSESSFDVKNEQDAREIKKLDEFNKVKNRFRSIFPNTVDTTNVDKVDFSTEEPYTDATDFISAAESDLEVLKTNALQENQKIKITGKIDAKKVHKDNKVTAKVTLKDIDSGDSSVTFDNVIKSLVTLVPNVTGNALASMYSSVAGKRTIKMGYPSIYKTNIEDIQELIVADKEEESKLKPKIIIKDILLQKFSINFDFSHLDEFGYPMSGKLTISEFWNLQYPSLILDLNEGNGQDKNLIESYVKY